MWKNEVDDYLNYTRSLGRNSGDNNSAREDSISFVAAEKQYMNAGFEGAVRSLSSYLNKYCPGGKFCSLALYYLYRQLLPHKRYGNKSPHNLQ